MNSGEAAESIVRMSLQGTEVALKITGEAAKNVAALMYAIYRGRKQTKGKTKLEKMLKSGEPLKIFSVRKDELKFFRKVAKRYGILYALLIDKHNLDSDGMVDIVVPASAAARFNRLINRYKFSTVKEESNIEHDEGSPYKKGRRKKKNEKSKDDKIVDDILSKPAKNEKSKEKEFTDEQIIEDLFSEDNGKNNSKKNVQSKDFLKNNKNLEIGTEKPSIMENLKNIKNEMNVKNNVALEKENDSIKKEGKDNVR